MRRIKLLGALASVVLVSGSAVQAGAVECQAAIAQYNSVLRDVLPALKAYSLCLDTSKGHDDCSKPFDRLRSAQSEFEDAVTGYTDACTR